MSETAINIYEGMFLFPQSATADLAAASQHVLDHLEKVGGEVVSFRKWDDRRLAYPIKGNKRGVYFLGFFKLSADKFASLERNLLLSEDVLRFLITRADHLSAEQMEALEGRTELADEIKLRGEQKADEVSASVRATTRAEREAGDEAGDEATEAPKAEDSEAPAEETPADTTDAEEPAAS
ncbi:MAG: 30S ribosomal protein S6 [Planctomycetes bacterium]|nr:30S ribosomal protein S6 [Planctomycetota bacterium]MCP4838046.1 30S ribosomal protein S6 [Planctomycetota bacterium]